MRHDKKRADGEHRCVLLERVGAPLRGSAVPEASLDRAVAAALGLAG
jgi:hypothetical protein